MSWNGISVVRALVSVLVSIAAVGCEGAMGVMGEQGLQGPQGPGGADGADGAPGQDGAEGLDSAVRLDPEPAGANCVAGGVAVKAGLDLDANGTLADSEVQSTQYVCSAPPIAGGTGTLEGSASIQNELDLARFAGYSAITGNLNVVQAVNLPRADLPALTSVNALNVEFSNGLTAFTAPLLTTVSGGLVARGDDALTELDVSMLTRIEGDLVIRETALSNLDGFAALESIGGVFFVINNPMLPTCAVNALRDRIGVANIGGAVTITGNDDTAVCP